MTPNGYFSATTHHPGATSRLSGHELRSHLLDFSATADVYPRSKL